MAGRRIPFVFRISNGILRLTPQDDIKDMSKVFFTPGPAQLYPTVKTHIKNALDENILSISHRSEKAQNIYAETVSNLKKLLEIPPQYKIFFLSSGTEAMERVIQNCAAQYSFHFVNGAFSKRFYKTSQELGKNARILEVKGGENFIFDKVKIPKETELICITQNETSSGVSIPPKLIYQLKEKYPKKLVAVDTVSSSPYINVDIKKLDLVFFSVQKGFGLPAGLAVLIVSPRAFQKSKTISKKGISIGSYHSFLSLDEYAVKNQTPETPNVLGIYLLGKVCRDMLDKGIENIRRETEEKAKLLYDFFAKKKGYKIFVADKLFRSNTVIVVEVDGGSKKLIEKLKTKGLIVSSGYGQYKESQIRIANFPAHTKDQILRLLKNI